jgi:hypothetical protein
MMIEKWILSVGISAVLFACPVAATAEVIVIVVRHEVADFATWQRVFEGGDSARTKAGIKDRYVVRDSEKPNFVTVIHEATNMERAKSFMSDPTLEEVMRKAGVLGLPEIKIGATGAPSPKR